MIVCIESFEHKNNEDSFSGLQFLRPTETFHSPTQRFLRQEVFLCQTVEHMPMNKIQGLCYVMYFKDYFKYQPIIKEENLPALAEDDVFVCESRYGMKTKMFKKIKWWNLPENKRCKLVQRDVPLENIRLPTTLTNQQTNGSDVTHRDVIEKVRETILYDSNVNEKLNENSQVKRDFYEQIVLSYQEFYKVGDFVYFNDSDKKFILRLEKIWKENE